jgi:flagellar hook protein FlgE
MAFQIDTSSIHSASLRLEVIGNNIANSNTAGFKGSEFDDVLATSMAGAIGAKKAGTRQSFSQGNITASSNPLDMAISGKGFFRVVSNGVASYTRNGQFMADKAGNIVNASGDQLSGYTVDANGKIMTGAPVPLTINPADYLPKATATATLKLTLDVRQPVIDSTATPFDPKNPTTYTHSTTTTVYDASGGAHDVQSFYVKTSATVWNVYGSVDGVLTPAVVAPAAATTLGSLTFDTSGALVPAAAGSTVGVFSVPVSATQNVSFDMSSAVQFGTSFAATMDQDGSPPGQMTGYKVGADGIITASYSNGRSVNMGQVILASFKNPDALAPTESNQWQETSASGAASLNTAGSGGLGTIQASSTEDANIDLTAEMIKMISAQRVFQAAAEMVKKQDQIMQTVVNIGQ